jgi:hypothetical protein
MKAFVIVSPHGLEYIGLHESSDDAWRIFLGWPTAGEVKQRIRDGWYCVEASVTWRKPRDGS